MEFNLEYLKRLIESNIQENLNLEYKSGLALDRQPNKTTEISKDISAFANSDGGIIIYGIKEGKNENKHTAIELEPAKKIDYPKEWLEQVINDKIRPRLEHLKIHPVELPGEDVVYVVEVGKSDTAHQAGDRRYYKRYNFQAVPMYDYEIRDILNRQKHPKLELSFSFENNFTALVIYISNVGSVLANYINVKIRLPKKIVGNKYGNAKNDMVEIALNNTIRDVIEPYAPIIKYGPSRYEPVLPQTKFRLTRIELQNHPFDAEHHLEWDIFCDSANPASDSIKMAEIFDKYSKS